MSELNCMATLRSETIILRFSGLLINITVQKDKFQILYCIVCQFNNSIHLKKLCCVLKTTITIRNYQLQNSVLQDAFNCRKFQLTKNHLKWCFQFVRENINSIKCITSKVRSSYNNNQDAKLQ